MIEYDTQYKALLKRIMRDGVDVEDRTGTGCRKVFDAKIKVDLSGDSTHYHIPVGSLRKIYPRTAFYEMLWMLRGSTNANELKAKNIHIWDANSSREFLSSRGLDYVREGWIGAKSYGYQFRNWNGHYDQLTSTIEGIINDPNGRRHFISLWNPSDFDQQALPPCHLVYNFVVTGNKLNLKFYMRSHDVVLANNVNILFASFFLLFMCQWTGMEAGEVAMDIADAHIYSNLFDAANYMIDADPIDRVWHIPKDSDEWNLSAPFSNDLLDRIFFDSDSYVKFVKQYNTDIEDVTNPPIPRELLQISA